MADRIFKSKDANGNEVELKLKDLTQVTLTKGDFIYREYFSKAIRAGVMTQAEANKILKERDIWGSAQDEEALSLQLKIGELEDKFDELDIKSKDGFNLYKELKSLRTQLSELNAIKGAVTDNTAESMAAEMRTQFFASECVVYNNNGRRVFKDLQDFLSRLDEQLATDSYREALINNYERALGIKIPKDSEMPALPEDEWLTKHEVADKEPPVKKTKTRKRKTKTKVE